jgi:RimJ/RimL family protein N-acetyltransferase
VQLGEPARRRVEAMWERWEAEKFHEDFAGVSVVILPWATYVRAPGNLRPRIIEEPPADIHTLVDRVSDVLERVVGIAHLWYADDDSLRLVHPGPLHTINELVAVATLQDWDGKVAHFGVFPHASARGRGLAPRTVSDAIAAVARRLGFEAIGRQPFVRVRNEP